MSETTQSTVYQMTTLTPGLAEKLLQDSSPMIIITKFWQFLTTDLMTAYLTEVQFLNIMDMVEEAFADLLTGIPEDLWHEVVIKEIIYDVDKNGNRIPIEVGSYNLMELWGSMYAKVYIKCTNSQEGHLIKALTEQRSSIQQLYEERGGIMRPHQIQPTETSENKGGWKP